MACSWTAFSSGKSKTCQAGIAKPAEIITQPRRVKQMPTQRNVRRAMHSRSILLNENIWYMGKWIWNRLVGCQSLTILLYFSDLSNQKMDDAIQGKMEEEIRYWGEQLPIQIDRAVFFWERVLALPYGDGGGGHSKKCRRGNGSFGMHWALFPPIVVWWRTDPFIHWDIRRWAEIWEPTILRSWKVEEEGIIGNFGMNILDPK